MFSLMVGAALLAQLQEMKEVQLPFPYPTSFLCLKILPLPSVAKNLSSAMKFIIIFYCDFLQSNFKINL